MEVWIKEFSLLGPDSKRLDAKDALQTCNLDSFRLIQKERADWWRYLRANRIVADVPDDSDNIIKFKDCYFQISGIFSDGGSYPQFELDLNDKIFVMNGGEYTMKTDNANGCKCELPEGVDVSGLRACRIVLRHIPSRTETANFANGVVADTLPLCEGFTLVPPVASEADKKKGTVLRVEPSTLVNRDKRTASKHSENANHIFDGIKRICEPSTSDEFRDTLVPAQKTKKPSLLDSEAIVPKLKDQLSLIMDSKNSERVTPLESTASGVTLILKVFDEKRTDYGFSTFMENIPKIKPENEILKSITDTVLERQRPFFLSQGYGQLDIRLHQKGRNVFLAQEQRLLMMSTYNGMSEMINLPRALVAIPDKQNRVKKLNSLLMTSIRGAFLFWNPCSENVKNASSYKNAHRAMREKLGEEGYAELKSEELKSLQDAYASSHKDEHRTLLAKLGEEGYAKIKSEKMKSVEEAGKSLDEVCGKYLTMLEKNMQADGMMKKSTDLLEADDAALLIGTIAALGAHGMAQYARMQARSFSSYSSDTVIGSVPLKSGYDGTLVHVSERMSVIPDFVEDCDNAAQSGTMAEVTMRDAFRNLQSAKDVKSTDIQYRNFATVMLLLSTRQHKSSVGFSRGWFEVTNFGHAWREEAAPTEAMILESEASYKFVHGSNYNYRNILKQTLGMVGIEVHEKAPGGGGGGTNEDGYKWYPVEGTVFPPYKHSDIERSVKITQNIINVIRTTKCAWGERGMLGCSTLMLPTHDMYKEIISVVVK